MFDLIENNDDFLVINKHPNVSVHKDQNEESLLMAVQKSLNLTSHLYLVHRLDKMTSGLLLLAKNAQTASELSQQFAQRKVEKYYLAIGTKKPKKKQGLISGDMARSRRSSWKLLTTQTNPAKTQFFSLAGDAGQRLFLCKPHTGKTHQIRVALASIGSPILGDPIYAPATKHAIENPDRGYLHAYALHFQYQTKNYQFVCIPKQDKYWQTASMIDALNQWQSPWMLDWPQIKTSKELKL